MLKVQPFISAREISNLTCNNSLRTPNPLKGCSGEDLEASRNLLVGTRRVVLGLGDSDRETVLSSQVVS